MERGIWKANVEISPNCPRCGSCNTKFCYYNNYSLSQPRYFCKGCRRYWTKGGSIRNVPVGGGCRKSRRGKSIRLPTDPVSTSSSVGPDRILRNDHFTLDMSKSSTIDLARVYSNFLNNHAAETRGEMTKLPIGIVDPSFQFPSVDSNLHLEFSAHFPSENGLVHCASNAMYFCGFASVHKEQEQETFHQSTSDQVIMNNHGLPPLPGEEIIPPNMVWSSSEIMLGISQMPKDGIEQDSDNFIGDQTSLDLSCYGSLSRP